MVYECKMIILFSQLNLLNFTGISNDFFLSALNSFSIEKFFILFKNSMICLFAQFPPGVPPFFIRPSSLLVHLAHLHSWFVCYKQLGGVIPGPYQTIYYDYDLLRRSIGVAGRSALPPLTLFSPFFKRPPGGGGEGVCRRLSVIFADACSPPKM